MKTAGIEVIQQHIAFHFGLDPATMKSALRAREFARPRQVAMFLARELTRRSLPEIGRQFGGRDHTTVLHACRRVSELMAEDASFAAEVTGLRSALGSIMPAREGFDVISLGEWLSLARKVNIPHVRATFLAEALIQDLISARGSPDPQRADRLLSFFKLVYGARRDNEIMRWDCCAPLGIKSAMARGANDTAPPHVISFDDPRFIEILDDVPPTKRSVAVWRRPWLPARTEGGYPVEYRVFVENGKVQGISNYYPQRVLQWSQMVDYEIKLATIYAEAMIAAQKAMLVNPQIAAAGLDPALMHCTLDFMATDKGLLFLEGGPPSLHGWGAHPCCFEGRVIAGIALGLQPRMSAA
jgi:hypothetical protein